MTVDEEMKIIEEIHKEVIKRGRLLYSYEIRAILDKFIQEGKELNNMLSPKEALQSCPSCGNCMWGYENGKMVCAVCGYIMERNEKE